MSPEEVQTLLAIHEKSKKGFTLINDNNFMMHSKGEGTLLIMKDGYTHFVASNTNYYNQNDCPVEVKSSTYDHIQFFNSQMTIDELEAFLTDMAVDETVATSLLNKYKGIKEEPAVTE